MAKRRRPTHPPPVVEGEGQIQPPIPQPKVSLSWEEYQKLLSNEVAEQAKQYIKRRVRWLIITFLIVIPVVGWLGYKSLESLVRQVMQPHVESVRDQLSNLKIAAGVANDASEFARGAARKATERAEEVPDYSDL
jgi:hypothetical protein